MHLRISAPESSNQLWLWGWGKILNVKHVRTVSHPLFYSILLSLSLSLSLHPFLSPSVSNTHSSTFTCKHTHSLTPTHTHTHTDSHKQTLTLTRSHTHSLYLSLSHIRSPPFRLCRRNLCGEETVAVSARESKVSENLVLKKEKKE